MDVEEAATELYQLAPRDFTARRGELAKRAKADGDAATATQVAALRRPTTSAWALNLLALERDEALFDLFDVADELRAAQGALDASRMAELTRRRRSLVGEVGRRAREAADSDGVLLSAAARREVEETLAAAVASEDAADVVASGRLTRSLSYAGFGDVDLSDATATAARPVTRRDRPTRSTGSAARQTDPPASSRRPHLRVVPDLPEDATARRARRAAEVRVAAEAAAEEARTGVDEASSALAAAQARADTLAQRVSELQHEIAAARAEAVEATRAVTTAERRHATAEVALQNARRALKKLPAT